MKDRTPVGFVFAVGILVAIAVTLAISSTQVLRLADDISRDLARIDAWNGLDTSVVELDRDATDYLTSRRGVDRDRYRSTRRRVDGLAVRIAELEQGAGVDRGHVLATLQHQLEAMDLVVESTSFPQTNTFEHRELIATIRALIADADDHAKVQERERDRVARAATIERIAQVAGLLTALIAVIAAFRRMRRDMAERRRMQTELECLNDELERRVTERTQSLLRTNEQLQQAMAERERTSANLSDAESQLRQSQKLEGIGQLAGGIAHDFNNLLSVVLTYSEMLLEDVPDTAHREDIAEIRNAALRAADLTRQLLAFSRRQVLAPKVVDVNDIVGGMAKLLDRVIGEHIDLRLVRRSTAAIEVDPGQLEQVIMNLVVNARDATNQDGTITVETSDVVLDETYAAAHPGVVAGPHVMIAVTDTGSGMTPEVQAQIFEPFFTTKPVGKGTGLGLSTVFGIIKQSRGSVWVYSEPNLGSTFKVYIPAVAQNPVHASEHRPAPHVGGSETILLVEDAAAVRKLARTILSRAGYHVLEATDGQDALRVWDDHAEPIDLVVTDVVMPKMGGRILAEKLAAKQPDLKIIYMSGYTDDMVVRHGVVDDTVCFIQKPLAQDVLLRKSRDMLNGRASRLSSTLDTRHLPWT